MRLSSVIRRSATVSILCSLLFVQVASSTTRPIQHVVNCNNGFQNAYYIAVIDESTGCIVAAWGVDCNGKEYIIQCAKRRVDADPGLASTFIDAGTAANGASYYIKAAITDGVVTMLWGKDASGEFYIADMTAQ